MRASASPVPGVSRHLSGAERLVPDDALDGVVSELFTRAQGRSPDCVQITVERVPAGVCVHHVTCLPVHTVLTSGPDAAAQFAVELLAEAGVASAVARAALTALETGLGPSGMGLRGASLWDRRTGTRLEPDRERGVRTSRFDYSEAGAEAIDRALAAQGLTHFRTREALAVATKTLWAGVAAELCWSDEPDYTTGYVATPQAGYVRLPHFKPDGAAGGRVFFLATDNTDVDRCIGRLEREYALLHPPARVSAPVHAAEYGK